MGKKAEAEGTLPGVPVSPAFEVEQVLAAVGLPSVPAPARRAALSDDLFAHPQMSDEAVISPSPLPELSDIIPKVVKRSSKDREVGGSSAPLAKLPYPFTGYGVQSSSKDQIPFPPSPGSRKEKRRSPVSSSSERKRSTEPERAEEVAKEEEAEEEEEEEEEDDGEEGGEVEESSEAHPRTSGSMSSLGQPMSSRYPFQFRRPHARGASASSSAMTPQSDTSPSSNERSGYSRSTQSTGNRETSASPLSHGVGSVMSSPTSGYGSPIPMPPRHPQPGRGRARAGTMPAFPSSPSPVIFPGRIPRIRTDSETTDQMPGGYESFLSEGHEADEENDDAEEEAQMMEQPEPEGPHEAAEGEDSVGLLSVVQRSPRSSNVSSRRRRGRRSDPSSSSRSNSVSSRSRAGSAVRSRTQSLIQGLGNASRSSVELVQAIRSRANSSVARLEEDAAYTSDSRSRSGSASHASSSHENYTFGQPMLAPMRRTSSQGLRATASNVSVSAPSEATTSHLTARQTLQSRSPSRSREYAPEAERVGVAVPAARHDESRQDLSTAAQSFITAPATIAGTSDSGEPVPSIWADTSHMVDRPGSPWRPA